MKEKSASGSGPQAVSAKNAKALSSSTQSIATNVAQTTEVLH